MKTFIFLIALIFTVNAFAGLGDFDSSTFNEIITDTTSSEKELRAKLQKEAGINPDLGPTGTISADKREIITDPSEHVAITSDKVLWNQTPNPQKDILKIEEKSIERLSEELDQSY